MSKINVTLDADLEEIVPGFLANRQKDLIEVANAIEHADFELVNRAGHKIAGAAGGYGFMELGEIGRRLEGAGADRDAAAARAALEEMRSYLERLEIRYDATP